MENRARELAAASAGRFTEDEIHGMIDLGNSIARGAVMAVLLRNIGTKHSEDVEIRREIDALGYAGKSRTLIINEGLPGEVIKALGPKAQLNLWLAIGDRNHESELPVPSEEFGEFIVGHYHRMRACAQAVWKTFCEEQPTLYDKIKKHFGDCMDTLKVCDVNPMTMYWDPAHEHRVVIMAAWSQGNQFYVKRK